MSHNFLSNASFHKLLIKIDGEIADKTRQTGCTCGGPLHRADYPRSPFGLPEAYREYYQQRLSLCCGQCRKRLTPQSVRFFGRRWFPGPIVILISALKQGATERRCAQIRRHFGIVISQSTWSRWRRWWRIEFVATSFWQQDKALVPIAYLSGPFPRTLLSVFLGRLEEQLVLLLRFLAPLTAGVLRAV